MSGSALLDFRKDSTLVGQRPSILRVSSGSVCWKLTGGALRVGSLPLETLLFLGK
jgi:hypothetical protein